MRALASRVLADPLAPIIALCVILVLSTYARTIDLGEPCEKPCETPGEHTLIFDEDYYVNAARVIDGINPPAESPYHNAPKGDDPNAEHPQLAKIVIALAIKLFGNDPRGWRLGSVLFSMIAMLALYGLVQAAGGSAWLAVGATGVMALDNLMLVQGRIGTLDIYAVAMMLVAAAFYMRRSPVLAGLALGIGACMKEVALYLIVVIVLFELLGALRAHRRDAGADSGGRVDLRALALFLGTTTVSTLGVLWLCDVLVPAYDPDTNAVYAGNPLAHLAHIYNYAVNLKGGSAHGSSQAVPSTPWQWLIDQGTINYARVAVTVREGARVISTRVPIYFQGSINPMIILLALPALAVALWGALRDGDRLARLGACWCVGTFLPFALGSAIYGHVTYLYYMTIVMPGVYIVVARMFARGWRSSTPVLAWAFRVLTPLWVAGMAYEFVVMYPLHTVL